MNQPLAYVHPGAKIAKNVVVEPFTTISNNVEIGEGTWVGSNVTIMEGARIGNNCFIYPGSVISANPQDLKFEGEDSLCTIGNNTTIRECVTINRGTKDRGLTKIGDNCLIMAYSHIAHDCNVGNDNIFANLAGIAGHVSIGNNVNVGAITTVHQFCKMGDFSFAGMNTSITMDVPAFVKVASDPARVIGLNSIGMKRNDIDEESVSLMKKAYKLLYRKNLKIEEALKQIKELHNISKDPYVEIFIKSIEVSERGILR